jgi:predicted ABC-type ATPase
MASKKRVRIFAGPNGSGKSSLFRGFQQEIKEKTGFFVNADEIELKLNQSSLIDLQLLGLSATQLTLDAFIKTSDSQSLIAKAKGEGHTIDLQIKENCLIDNSKGAHRYEGSFVASFIRHLLVEQNKSFSFETVMSHPSKVGEIIEMKEKGYAPYLYFVCIDKPEVNISRIINRVVLGEHDVPKEKVIERYSRSLELLHQVLPLCYRAYLFDNSGKEYELIAELYQGVLEIKTNQLPQWFIQYVLPYYE